MAIVGLLVHALADKIGEVEAQVKAMPGMTVYGVHQEQYLVTVVEAPSERLEEREKQLKAIDGVLTVYAAYLNLEDELAAETAGGR